MSQDDIAVVVDENDRVLQYKRRADLTLDDRIRISAVWIENSQGEVLIAKRSLAKKVDPGCWGPAAAGTVEKHESCEDNAAKELAEEIGVNNVTLVPLRKHVYTSSRGHKRVCQWFRLQLDRSVEQFTLQADEVDSVRWISKAELARAITSHPETFVGSATMWPNLFELV